MTFKRASYYGTSFDWYAVDAGGHIARFDTGYGPMPRRLFEDEAAYSRVSDFFQSASLRCSASLSALAQELANRHAAEFELHLRIASQGLFAYDERDYGPKHELYAIPESPLLVSSVPSEMARFLGLFVIPGCRFRDSAIIDVSKVFDCIS